MKEINIPGYKTLQIRHLVLDYNGTLACDGQILPGVKECLTSLAEIMQIHILTADTFGQAAAQVEGIPLTFTVLMQEDQHVEKANYVKRLGCEHTASIGNGRNDRLMLKASVLGIAVILKEGLAAEALLAADMVFGDILSALEIFQHPLRMTATLRE